MSGRITDDEKRILEQLGVMDVIYKPFTMQQLEEVIAAAFSRQER
jgi:DNA-binding response OmpR family regulator